MLSTTAKTRSARAVYLRAFVFGLAMAALRGAAAEEPLPGATLHLGFESEDELLADFVSHSARYKALGRASLAERKLAIGEGRFGNGLYIQDGSPVSKGTWNESGLDCDLVVAVIWGEWHKKPHYWGSGAFYGQRGTVAFWVKAEQLRPGVVFMQGSIGWGRKERDLFAVQVDRAGRFSAYLRDVRSQYHRVSADRPTWRDGQWQHVAVTYDRAYGMKLFCNGVLVGSTWGEDAWWQAPLPGLFSLFLEESHYDELRLFDLPLSDRQVAALYRDNSIDAEPAPPKPLEPAARQRLLAAYGDVEHLELPTLTTGQGTLALKQIDVRSCHDGSIPAWWVLDGRYELAWPHPYRLFTFILGDADFHGTKVDLELPAAAKPNYIAFEGTLDALQVLPGRQAQFSTEPIVALGDYAPFFYSQKVDLSDVESLRLPLVKGYGSPPDLEGSARIPLTGSTRIHEIHLWHADQQADRKTSAAKSITWQLSPGAIDAGCDRYAAALARLMSHGDRAIISGETSPRPADRLTARPLQSVHFASGGLGAGAAVDAIGLRLLVEPRGLSDVLWLKLRDPANPARIWAQICLRVRYAAGGGPQELSLKLDIIDLLFAAEDRILLEVVSAEGQTIRFGAATGASALTAFLSPRPQESRAAYVKHEMHPARMQYMKEYNYRPWRFTGQPVGIESWPVFGGPFDMAYPTLAVLRHDPENRLARTYHTLLFERNWFGSADEEGGRQAAAPVERPEGAPEWAVWQRALYALNRRVTDWIVAQQREDGMFWGGVNDDPFIPLGWAALPLLGERATRRSWLRFYDGLAERGIFHDGYCDIWPIDPLHITDYITSRGLMLSFALGNPQVFERELRTAERYTERVRAADRQRAARHLAPLTGDPAMRNREEADLRQQMDAEIRNYSRTHVGWYWGDAPTPPPHAITDRAALAAQLMQAVQQVDETAIFGFTKARVHTDNQRGIGREVLIASALGGRLQGRAEPFPPSIAVSWEEVETADLARLVSSADATNLTVNLYNFRPQPIDAVLRLWRLQSGAYELSMGPDADDDGRIDAAAASRRQVHLGRFATIPLTIAPRCNTALRVRLLGEPADVKPLPDLAISKADVCSAGNGAVAVTVHNIGAAAARDVRVALADAEGHIVDRATIDRLESPRADLAARRKTVTLTAPGKDQQFHVLVDPDNLIEETFEENNRCTWSGD